MNQFQIGIIADWLHQPFAQSMETCAKMGADGVQVYAVDGEMAPENLSAAARAEKRRIIEGNGLVVSALCGDLGGHGFARAQENKTKVERSKRIVDLALDMGTTVVTTHIGVVPADSSSDTYKVMQAACRELGEYARSVGVTFAIETGPEPAARLRDFLDSLGTGGVGVNMDPANLVMVTDDDPVAAVHTLAPYIVHTHAKDGVMRQKTDPQVIYDFFAEGGIGDLRLSDYFLETPLGQGQVDFPAYLAALREIGFHGFLTIEREVGEDPSADIALAVRFLKQQAAFNA
ncbi:MAG TPA: sugar phosphate isomerase/epimerase [Firmicutes bacterium]|nr:sugar phosphate isomerase/epimerase [Bacillota bacterium]